MKKRFAVFAFMFLMLVVSASMCACGPLDPGPGKTGKTTPKPTQDKEGWEPLEFERTDMYARCLNSFTKFAYMLSKDGIKDKNHGQATLKGNLKATLNDNDFYIAINAKYDDHLKESDKAERLRKVREDAMIQVDISKDREISDENRIATALIYKDELYCAMGANKVKFDFSNSNWWDYYPYVMAPPTEAKALAGAFNTMVELKKEPEGERRMVGTKTQFRYRLAVDLAKTLSQMSANLKKTAASEQSVGEIEKLDDFIAKIFGVSASDVRKGKLPDSDIKLEFVISNDVIDDLSADFSVDLSEGGSLIVDKKELEDGKLRVSLDVEDSIKIGNDCKKDNVVLSLVNDTEELKKYGSHKNSVFYSNVPISLISDAGEKPNYRLRIITKVFQDEPQATNADSVVGDAPPAEGATDPDGSSEESSAPDGVGMGKLAGDPSGNYVFFEYFDTEADMPERALYACRNDVEKSNAEDEDVGTAYFFVRKDGALECVGTHPCDLGKLAKRIVENDFGEDEPGGLTDREDKKLRKSKIDVFNLVGYILRNTFIYKDKINFLISEDFFRDVWYNFDNMIAWLDGNPPKLTKEIVDFVENIKTNKIKMEIDFFSPDFLSIIDDKDGGADGDFAKIIDPIFARIGETEVAYPKAPESGDDGSNGSDADGSNGSDADVSNGSDVDGSNGSDADVSNGSDVDGSGE